MGRLLTVQEAADFLKVSRSSVYRYCEQNVIPHIKKSFGIRFKPEDLEKWLEQDNPTHPSDAPSGAKTFLG